MFWKIKFNDGLDGIGYLEFNQDMVAINIYKENGELVNEPVGYYPIEFDVIPNF